MTWQNLKEEQGSSAEPQGARAKSTAARVLPWAVALLGLAMMAWGWHDGELAVLFSKATRICMECVGIG